MPIVIACPHCSRQISLADDSAGKQFRCPLCQKMFVAGRATVPVSPPSPSRQNPSRPVSTASSASVCPACSAPWLDNADSCMECGFLLRSEVSTENGENTPNLCPNPACGVANPPTERYCQRCTSPLPTAPGTVLHGRYRIKKLLAIGGFGAVYLAEDLRSSQLEVAIKDMICADSEEFALRLNFFRREAEILRTLSHMPIVPRFYDLIEQEKSAYLVMEFIRGLDLLKLMESTGNRPFPLSQVIEWGKAICDVLTHLHSQSPPIVHRDLKPDNIMLLPDRVSIKLIDFGTARDLGRTSREQMRAKTRVYTEGYAPPEQIVGKPEPRSDLFALAGTLYHLATGKPPEGFYTAKEIARQLADSTAIPPEQRWFFELLQINLAEDIHERYHSAPEFKADLEKRQVTRERTCPRCRTSNPVREPYCCRCAEALTEPTPPCHHCGKVNRMGSRCCIHCGNRLR